MKRRTRCSAEIAGSTGDCCALAIVSLRRFELYLGGHAGEDAASPPALTPEKKAEITRQLQPSGFDPVPLLKQMTVPGIWVYGRQDRSQPAEKSAATLERLRTTEGKDFTAVLFPQAGHGLLDNPPSDRRAMPALLAWIQKQVRTT